MLWALSDLHLPGGTGKTMDRFGEGWTGHAERIEASWRGCVGEGDIVLVPGDISWAARPADAAADLAFLGSLPGTKYITRGNHDYWWKSKAHAASILPEGVHPLLDSAVDLGSFALCAARGWTLPASEHYVADRDDPILRREVGRLRTAVDSASGMTGKPLVAMMHFAPTEDGGPSEFTRILSDEGVSVCVFGHLHGAVSRDLSDFVLDGVRFIMCSADQVGFTPVRIPVEGSTMRRF